MESRESRRSQWLLRKVEDPASSCVLDTLSTTRDAENWPSRMERIITVAMPKRSAFNKRKTSHVRKRLDIGRMTFVLRFPLDVFIEITSYLSVLDLLNLSYVSWDLHSVMLSKSFRPTWREALKDIGAPECMPDINEPQFVDLVFRTFCHGCGARVKLDSIDYGLRIRLCSGCSSLNLNTGSQLLANLPDVFQKDTEILRLCYYQRGQRFFQGDHSIVYYRCDANSILMQRKYFAPDFEDVAREYMATASASTEREKFIRDRKDLVNDICCDVRTIESWLRGINYWPTSGRTPEGCLRAHLRKRSILTRLKSLGYSDGDLNGNLDYDAAHRWKKLLEQPYELTERIWSRIYPEVTEIIFEKRTIVQRYFLEGIRGAYEQFANNWGEEEYGPVMNFEDVKRLPEVQSLIERNGAKKSFLSVGERASILELLPEANAALKALIKENCINVITAARESAGLPPYVPDTPDMLDHASTFFLERGAPFDQFMQCFPSLACHRVAAWEPLTSQCPKVIKIASALLRSLKLPGNSTLSVMEQMGQRFVCRRCKQKKKCTEKMSWPGLVYHFLREAKWYEKVTEYLADNPSVKMKAIDSHNVDSPGELAEVVDGQEGAGEVVYKYRCTICRKATPDIIIEGYYSLVIGHIRASHGKSSVSRYDYEIAS